MNDDYRKAIRGGYVNNHKSDDKKKNEVESIDEDDLYVSMVVKGYSNIYVKVNEDEAVCLCNGDRVEIKNLKKLDFSIENSSNICQDCIEVFNEKKKEG